MRKLFNALLVAPALFTAEAHETKNGHVCTHGKNEKPAYHYYRSTLEDLDLAAGRNQFTGHTVTKKVTVITYPDGTRKVITEGGDDGEQNELNNDFDRFFESGPGGHRFRGSDSPFGGSFGHGSPFGKSPFDDEEEPIGGPFGGMTGQDAFDDLFRKLQGGMRGGAPTGRPTGRPTGQPGFPTGRPTQPGVPTGKPATGKPAEHPQGEPIQPNDEDLDELLRKLAGGELGRIPDEPIFTPPKKPQGKPIEADGPVKAPSVGGSGYDESELEEMIRRLQGGSSKPQAPLKQEDPKGSDFRIVLDYSTLTVGTPEQHAYIKNRLMPVVVDYFKAALRLKYPLKDKITIPEYQTDCDGPVPKKYYNEGVEGDLVIMIRTMDEPQDGAVAQAMTCSKDSRSGRSISSSINFNLGHIDTSDKDELTHLKNVYTTSHELTHVLGFTSQHMQNFLNPDGTRNKKALIETDSNLLLNVEPLTSKLRKYFNCDSLQGAPLENQGGSGSANSHFERRVFFNEYMSASEIHDAKISEFSLALLEGSGWYVVDYSRAEPFHIGQGNGCAYVTGKCMENGKAAFPEFCSVQKEQLCSANYNAMAMCNPDPFSDGCGLPHTQSNMDCRNAESVQWTNSLRSAQAFGPEAQSKCFMGNVYEPNPNPRAYSSAPETGPYCFKYKCNGTGSTMTLDVILGQKTANCTKKGPITVNGLKGNLECPDPVEFCSTVESKQCPRGCSGRGTCNEGKCVCNSGFKGSDCSYFA